MTNEELLAVVTKFACLSIIGLRFHIVAKCFIAKSATVIHLPIIRIQFDGFIKVRYRCVVVLHIEINITSIDICVPEPIIFRFQLNNFRKISYSCIVVLHIFISIAAIEVRLRILRIKSNCFRLISFFKSLSGQSFIINGLQFRIDICCVLRRGCVGSCLF